jgi:hypothetical protein
LKELEADLDLANENFNMVDGQFAYINEELRLKEDEARQRALQQQRTAVFNMVKNDGHLVKGVVDTLQDRIEKLNKRIAQLGGTPVTYDENGKKGPAEGYEKEFWTMRVFNLVKGVLKEFSGEDLTVEPHKANFLEKVMDRLH